MDTQNAAPAVLEGIGRLERSSWKAEAIRRGQLKISGPIPWVDDGHEKQLTKRHTDPFLPSTSADLPPQQPQQQEEEGKEPEQQQQAQGLAQEQKPDSHSQLQADVNPDPPLNHHHQQQPHGDQEYQQAAQLEVKEGTGALQHDRPETSLRPLSEMQRHTSPNLTTSYHSPTPQPSGTNSPTNMTSKKKRRSGLRTVFRKMFGRKSPKDEDARDASPPRHEPPPPTTNRKMEQTAAEISATATELENIGRNARIFSVPFQEIQPRTPLGSHLPFPMNVNAPEEISPPHEYLTFEDDKPAQKTVHRRRASLPSVVFSSTEAAALSAYWAADSLQEQQGPSQRGVTDEPEIGIAVSSPRHLKRRSRSAGALQEMARNPPLQIETVPAARTPRRRSAEIRYWRGSGMDRSISVYSDPKTVQRDESGRTAVGSTEAASVAAARDTIQLDPEQISAFNFGNLTGNPQTSPGAERTPTMTEQSTVSYEDTPFREEDNQEYLEQILPISTSRAHHSIVLEDAPKGKRSSRERSSSSLKGDGSSHTSSTTRVIGFSADPSSKSGTPSPPLQTKFLTSPSPDEVLQLAAFSEFANSPFNMASPPSLTNLRGGAFFDLNSNDKLVSSTDANAVAGGDTLFTTAKAAEQFSAIYTILRHERAARKSLERQVATMQNELQELRLLTTKLANLAASQNHATIGALPSCQASTNVNGGVRPRPSKPAVLDNDDKRETITSRFSRFEDSGDEDDATSEQAGRSPEVFETPREESVPYAFGFGTIQTARAVTVGESSKF